MVKPLMRTRDSRNSNETDVEVYLGSLKYRELSVPSAVEEPFFQVALGQAFDSVSCYEIRAPDEESCLPVTDRAFLAPTFEDGYAFVEATRPVNQLNKESLTTLLELAEEANCSKIVALVDKNTEFKSNIIGSYLSIGFSLIMKPTLPMPDYVLLAKEIDG